MLNVHQVAEMIGMSWRTVYRWENEGTFPERFRIASKRIAWRETEVEEWLANVEVGKTLGRLEASEMTGLHWKTLRRFERDGKFPVRVRAIGRREKAWREADVLLWLDKCQSGEMWGKVDAIPDGVIASGAQEPEWTPPQMCGSRVSEVSTR